MRRRAALAALVAGLFGAGRGAAQEPRSTPRLTFATGVQMVRLSVTVTDGRDRPVTGLTRDDFVVLEDARPQELAYFQGEDRRPVSLALLLDTSASVRPKLDVAKAAAQRFVGTLGEGDRAQVVAFSDTVRVLQDFTGDRLSLNLAIAGLRSSGPTALHNALYVALKSLGRVADERRREAIVLLSDGDDTASLVWEEQVVELARQAELAVYAISLRSRPREGEPGRAARLLSLLAHESGGRVEFPDRLEDLEGVYDSISRELRSQYEIGYVPGNLAADGRWREVEVRVRGRGGLRIRHKRGYYADY